MKILREYVLVSPGEQSRLILINVHAISFARGVTPDEEKGGANCVIVISNRELHIQEPYTAVREDMITASQELTWSVC